MSYAQIMKKFGRSFVAAQDMNKGLTRRQFIKLTGLSGLAIGIGPAVAATDSSSASENTELSPRQQPSEFLHIAPNGTVTIQINRLEFGQGSHTGLARILAEELDADWGSVNAVLAKAGEAYKDPLYNIQMTGGSTARLITWIRQPEL